MSYETGFKDGLQAGIDLAEHLRDAWRDAGSSKGLVRGAAIIAFLLTKRKADDGSHTRGESGTDTSGTEARVDVRDTAGTVDEGVLVVADGSGGDVHSSGATLTETPTPEQRLAWIRDILNRAEKPDEFHKNGFANQYEALADLYDEDFATELHLAVEG